MSFNTQRSDVHAEADERLRALWVVVRVGTQHFAFEAANVVEMAVTPPVHAVPLAPAAVRGVAKVRGQVAVLVDLRTRLGMPPLSAEQGELVALLHAREKDHTDWIDDLEASVRENRPFTRTLDPHACAFGKWYDQYKAPSPELAWHLQQFAEPHSRIHLVGAAVRDEVARGRTAEALELIEYTKTTVLHRLIELFEKARHIIVHSAREIAVVVNVGGAFVSLLVDEVVGLDTLRNDAVGAVPVSSTNGDSVVLGTGHLATNDAMVLLLDLAALTEPYAELAGAH